MAECLARHVAGDWGEALSLEDVLVNSQALDSGARLISVYPIDPNRPDGERFWIITDAADDEGKRAVTTLLLPNEY
jgi:hypothetical protein